MSRSLGDEKRGQNFEILATAPIDARHITPTKSSLTSLTGKYNGMICAVNNDTTNNGLYICSQNQGVAASDWTAVGSSITIASSIDDGGTDPVDGDTLFHEFAGKQDTISTTGSIETGTITGSIFKGKINDKVIFRTRGNQNYEGFLFQILPSTADVTNETYKDAMFLSRTGQLVLGEDLITDTTGSGGGVLVPITGYILQVDGNSYFNGNLDLTTTGDGTGTDGSSQLKISDDESSNPQYLKLGVNSTSNYSYIQSTESSVGQRVLALNPLGGNVGIGTTTPLMKLDVAGSIRLGSWADTSRFVGLTGTDNDNFISGMEIESVSVVGNYSQNIHLRSHHHSTTEGRRLTVQYDGKIGIGNTNPSKTLDVTGDINFTGTLYQNGSAFSSGSSVTVETSIIDNNTNPVTSNAIFDALAGKQDSLTFNHPSFNNSNPSTAADIYQLFGQCSPVFTSNFRLNANLVGHHYSAGGNVSNDEYGYLGGVTSSIQDQLDDKLNLTGGTLTGNLQFGNVTTYGITSVQRAIYFHNTSTNYAIFRAAGAWTSPNYPPLVVKFITGLVLDGGTNASYNNAYVKVNGKMGVNVSSKPTSQFEVNGTAEATKIILNSNDSDAIKIQHPTLSADFLTISSATIRCDGGTTSGKNMKIINSIDTDMEFRVGQLERMAIKISGSDDSVEICSDTTGDVKICEGGGDILIGSSGTNLETELNKLSSSTGLGDCLSSSYLSLSTNSQNLFDGIEDYTWSGSGDGTSITDGGSTTMDFVALKKGFYSIDVFLRCSNGTVNERVRVYGYVLISNSSGTEISRGYLGESYYRDDNNAYDDCIIAGSVCKFLNVGDKWRVRTQRTDRQNTSGFLTPDQSTSKLYCQYMGIGIAQ